MLLNMYIIVNVFLYKILSKEQLQSKVSTLLVMFVFHEALYPT
jgi:hypothetical protein